MASLPSGPRWMAVSVQFEGFETLEDEPTLYFRDPIECLRILYSDPRFKDSMRNSPFQEFDSEHRKEQFLGSFLSGHWAADTQVRTFPFPIE
jgi:hypothetical protein